MKYFIRHLASFGFITLFILFSISSAILIPLGVNPFAKKSLPCEFIDPPQNRTTTIQVDVIDETGIGVGGITVKVQSGIIRTVVDQSLGGYCLRIDNAESVEEDFYVTGPNGTVVFTYVNEAKSDLDYLSLKAESADASYTKNYDYGIAYLGGNGYLVLSAIKKDEL